MSLPTCPSCGQSVLEDNVVDCPFCGAAMDGSRGAKNTPRPKANPVANRPGARKIPAKPDVPSSQNEPAAEAPKPVSRPIATGRASKPKVDEDDPFGMGTSAAALAIQATAKPEKGRLHKVTCPMCEQVGFVPKGAVGKSVRCANEKCMVPVFLADDPNVISGERKPARMSDAAEAARKSAESATQVKRSPMIMYGIVGVVLLGLAFGVVQLLNRKPDTTDLNTPVLIDPKNFGPDDEETDRLQAEADAIAQAAIDAANPRLEVTALVKRMIGLARQPVRDKALARRMTGDLYLRLSDSKLAAQEFNQLVDVERSRAFYRMEPYISHYWRSVTAGDQDAAKKAFEDALAERQNLAKSGRAGTEAALGLAAALVNEGRQAEAVQLVGSRQLDMTQAGNRDATTSTAWFFVAGRCRDASLPIPAVLETLLWNDPLSTAVAVDLAIQQRWTEGIGWAVALPDGRTTADCLVAIAEIAALRNVPPDVITQFETAAAAADAVHGLRIRAAIAAMSKDAAKLDACLAAMQQLPALAAIPLPNSTELVQQEVPDRSSALKQGIAIAEIAKAAAVAGTPEQVAAALARLTSDLAGAAPQTAALRTLTIDMAANEAAYKKRIAAEMRVGDVNQFTAMFRNYRKHIEQLATAAEDRRLLHLLLLSRVVRSGGLVSVQEAINDSAELKQEVLLDELSGIIAVAARMAGKPFPELFTPDVSLRQGQAGFGNAQTAVGIAGSLEIAWANRDVKLAAGLQDLANSSGGKSMPGLRQALFCELIESSATTSNAPETVLAAISTLPAQVFGIWREEANVIAARVFADRGLEKQIEAWILGQKLSAFEQFTLLYGISLGLLERPVPTVDDVAAKSSAAQTDTSQK